MRIAIFSDTFPPEVNGVANYSRLSADALSKLGHKVEVYTVSRLSEKKINEQIGKGYYKINIFPSIKARFYPDARISLPSGQTFTRLRKFKPDIIHAHTPFVLGWEAVMGAKILKIPLVGTHHTFYDHYLKHVKIDFKAARKFTWKYTIGFYNFCNKIMVPSHSLAQEMKEHGVKKPIAVIPNFVSIKHFKPATNIDKIRLKKIYGLPDKSIVHMGRLSYEKSVNQVLKAFKLVLKKNPNIKLMIVGDGPEKTKLQKLARSLNVKDEIIFTGFLKGRKLVQSLQANDVFITASKTETFCLAALEAMGTGLPAIATSDKGIKEVVRNNVNGYLVEPDNVGEMANKILKLLENDEKIKKFSLKSRAIAETYSKERIIGKIENIYKKIIRERNK